MPRRNRENKNTHAQKLASFLPEKWNAAFSLSKRMAKPFLFAILISIMVSGIMWGGQCAYTSYKGGKETRTLRMYIESWEKHIIDNHAALSGRPARVTCDDENRCRWEKGALYSPAMTWDGLLAMHKTHAQAFEDMVIWRATHLTDRQKQDIQNALRVNKNDLDLIYDLAFWDSYDRDPYALNSFYIKQFAEFRRLPWLEVSPTRYGDGALHPSGVGDPSYMDHVCIGGLMHILSSPPGVLFNPNRRLSDPIPGSGFTVALAMNITDEATIEPTHQCRIPGLKPQPGYLGIL